MAIPGSSMCRREIRGIRCGSGSIEPTSRACAEKERWHPRQAETQRDSRPHGKIQSYKRTRKHRQRSPLWFSRLRRGTPLRGSLRCILKRNPWYGKPQGNPPQRWGGLLRCGRPRPQVRETRRVSHRRIRHSAQLANIQKRRHRRRRVHDREIPLLARHSNRYARIRQPHENRMVYMETRYPKKLNPQQSTQLRHGRNACPEITPLDSGWQHRQSRLHP